MKRSESFWNRKIVIGSTPTVKGYSRIEKSFEEGDQRRYHVPCPHCGEFQVLEWGGPDTPHGMKWDKDENGVGIPESVYYVCKVTGCVIKDEDKPDMVAAGVWIRTASQLAIRVLQRPPATSFWWRTHCCRCNP